MSTELKIYEKYFAEHKCVWIKQILGVLGPKILDSIFWVTQKLPQMYTANHATFPIQIRKITVQICGNFWVAQYIAKFMQKSPLTPEYTLISVRLFAKYRR